MTPPPALLGYELTRCELPRTMPLVPREDVSATPACYTADEATFQFCGTAEYGGGLVRQFGGELTVPRFFICDKASIPGASLITPKRLERPAVAHDYLYRRGCAAAIDDDALKIRNDDIALLARNRKTGREFADRLFGLFLTRCATLTAFQRWRIIAAVRLFGRSSYDNADTRLWAARCGDKIFAQ